MEYWKKRIKLLILSLKKYNKNIKLSDRERKVLLYDFYGNNNYRWFFPKKRIGYIAIEKVALTSIKQALINNRKFNENIHTYYSQYIDKEVKKPDDYFIFSFVRNPFDRLVSAYKDKVKNEKSNYIYKIYLDGFLLESQSFSEFVDRISVIPKNLYDKHFNSQYAIIYGNEINNKIEPNFIGRFENIEKDWKFLQEKFNLGSLPHENATKKDDWRDYYDVKTAKLVYKIYKKDFKTFGYEDEYQKLLEYLNKKQNE